MRDTGLDDRSGFPPVLPEISRRAGLTWENRTHSTRWTGNGRTGPTSNGSSKHSASTRPARFGTLPLQEARVLQQLQTLSITATPANEALSKRQTKHFVPKRKPSFAKQPKLRRSKVDLTGNTDSEVDSPQSQPVVHNHYSLEAGLPRQTTALPEAPAACCCADGMPAVCTVAPSLPSNHAQSSASASAVTPSRTVPPLLPDCVTDTPESMAMSTPACGQPLSGGRTTPVVPMSCSTTGNDFASHLRHDDTPVVGSPMCISPDTWATPQQLQWELPSESPSAAPNPSQPLAKALSPSASQLHLANLQYGLDAINDAAAAATAAAGTRRRSRLASRTMADQREDLSDTETATNSNSDIDGCTGERGGAEGWSQGSSRGSGGFAEDAEWREDFEVTPTPSHEVSPTRSGGASSPQAELQLTLGSDDEGLHQNSSLQVKGLCIVRGDVSRWEGMQLPKAFLPSLTHSCFRLSNLLVYVLCKACFVTGHRHLAMLNLGAHLSFPKLMQDSSRDRGYGSTGLAAEAATSSPTAGAPASVRSTPAGKRTSSVHECAEAANVSPEKRLCTPSCAATAAIHPSSQQQSFPADKAPISNDPMHRRHVAVASGSQACQIQQPDQAAVSGTELAAANDQQLQAAHAQYVAALQAGKQPQEQRWPQQQSAHAGPHAHQHLQADRQQLPQPFHHQPPQQLQHKQRQHLPKHLHDIGGASEQLLPQRHQQQLPQEQLLQQQLPQQQLPQQQLPQQQLPQQQLPQQQLPQHLPQQQLPQQHLPQQQLPQQQLPQHLPQHLLEQQQALAAYQAALGRPAPAPVAGPSAHGITTQHQLHAQQPNPAMQQRQAQGAQHEHMTHGQVVEQGPRKVQGSVALPCHATQAQNVYKAFQWQKDAIDFANACNRQATGLKADASEPGAISDQAQHEGQQADSRQHGAADPTSGVPDIVKVFCEEAGSDAGYFRQFVAASYGRFWARYAPRLGQRPHCYEVVKGGAPCHLYFDTEFATECNPGLNGEVLLDRLLQACRRVISKEFQLVLQPEWIYELDSSHAGKFSRHLILRLPGAAFVNNWAVGHLVGQILAEPEGMEILVRKKCEQPGSQQFTSLVDTAVYTRNRHFRLIWSCKAGKAQVLNPTNRFATGPGCNKSQRELFLETLICNVDQNSRLLMTDVVPAGLAFHSSHLLPHSFGSSRHVGYIVHGQHEVKVTHKCDAADGFTEAAPLTQERVQGWAEQAGKHVEEVATCRAGGLPASVRTIAHCGFAGTVAYSLTGMIYDSDGTLGAYIGQKWALQHKSPVQFRLVSPRLGQPKRWAGVAQLVERKALNLVVKGSSPFFGDKFVLCP
ncbi:hypothetical protein ABBQ38_009063 [Trebouxia sp. C0009 RCD-2024]